MSQSGPAKMPVLFISHGGGPWAFMDQGPDDPYAGLAKYLRELPQNIRPAPRAVLVISGHWEEAEFTVMTNPRPPLLYDYYGFPEYTYRLKYDAPGSPDLATRTRELLLADGIPCQENPTRGLDHGVFVPLYVSYPRAEMPIVQLSMKQDYDPQTHLEVGRALAPLRKEGVLLIGSGLSYHNLRAFGTPPSAEWSRHFDEWLTDAVTAKTAAARNRKLQQWAEAPAARHAHPREDHLVPLFVAAGAAEEDLGIKNYRDIFRGMEISGYRFG